MRCQECGHEWTPPPLYNCPRCGAEIQTALPRFDPRPMNTKASLALTLVFASLIAFTLTPYATVLPLISIVLAMLGLVEIKRSNGRMLGAGYAVVAIIASSYLLIIGTLGLLEKFR